MTQLFQTAHIQETIFADDTRFITNLPDLHLQQIPKQTGFSNDAANQLGQLETQRRIRQINEPNKCVWRQIQRLRASHYSENPVVCHHFLCVWCAGKEKLAFYDYESEFHHQKPEL